MPKRNEDYFKPFRRAARGTAELGIATAVGAGIAAKAPPGAPSLMGGFTTLAGFVPVATTAVIGKGVLDLTKKLQPRKRRRKRR